MKMRPKKAEDPRAGIRQTGNTDGNEVPEENRQKLRKTQKTGGEPKGNDLGSEAPKMNAGNEFRKTADRND